MNKTFAYPLSSASWYILLILGEMGHILYLGTQGMGILGHILYLEHIFQIYWAHLRNNMGKS